jgi:N-acetylglutamate synthase-like GNAT family acetyltransferase
MPLSLPADLRIGPAALDDLRAIFDAHQDSVSNLCADSYSPAQMQTWFEGRTLDIHRPAVEAGQLLIAEQQGRVLGFVGFVPGEVTLLFVRPEAAGCGLGSRLLMLGVERAELGHAGPVVVVATRNSKRFYEKHGFAAVEESFFVRGVAELRFETVNMRCESLRAHGGS